LAMSLRQTSRGRARISLCCVRAACRVPGSLASTRRMAECRVRSIGRTTISATTMLLVTVWRLSTSTSSVVALLPWPPGPTSLLTY
ncbi:hypothetical protein IWW38_003652, partial [Coemansia aciculifera]